MPIPAAWNRAPLPPNSLTPLPPCAIRAAGWLRTQIERERPRNEEDRLLCAVLLGDAALERRAQAEAEAYLDTEPQDCLGRAGWLMRYYGFRGDKRVPRRCFAPCVRSTRRCPDIRCPRRRPLIFPCRCKRRCGCTTLPDKRACWNSAGF